ncbi:MAG TPA: calcium:proton antiporter [Luteibacter sp.]|jgi:Ca2+:H+ antiporter|nr:calcium:proton antiporter [Luteibacter sp.]
MATGNYPSFIRREWFLAVTAATCLIFLVFSSHLVGGLDNPWRHVAVFSWLFTVVLGSALSVVRHAERLAERLGEPFGTLILTLSVTAIEVMSVAAVMLHGDNNPTLARDTLFAVAMIVLNGMVGLSLLMGGWRYREQAYNLQGANAYLGVIIPLGVLGLVMPSFARHGGPHLSFAQEMFLVVVSSGLYAAFIMLQTHRHRGYFIQEGAVAEAGPAVVVADVVPRPSGGIVRHALLLLAYLVPVIYLAQKLAYPVDYAIETLHAPVALGGVAMAVIVATPEAIGAVRAASANHLQRSINIFLGSVLSTIGLTIPAIIIVGQLTGHPIELGLQHTDLALFLLTLTSCVVTFSSGRTNVLQGVVHLMLFAAYLFLIFE